jgi:alkylhydroperoxidase family enzyme
VIADPRTVGTSATDRVLVGLARLVTEAPWTLGQGDLARAHDAGLDDDAILHVIVLSAFFGYLNRIADAVGIELDYDVAHRPPAAVADTPPLGRPERSAWPDPDAPRPLELARRPLTAEAVADCHGYLHERARPLAVRQRQLIARAVAERLGDAATVRALAHVEAAQSELDRALEAFADVMTLAPWRLGASSLDALRAASLTDDAAIFDAVSVAAFSTTASRVTVALAALARP